MLSLKKKQPKPVAEIHLAPNNDSPSGVHTWLTNEDINGHALFKLPIGVDFSHSKIAFRGTITTKTDEYPGALQKTWRTESLAFVGVSLSSTAGPNFRSDNGSVKIPFQFNLEDIHSQVQGPSIADLPPSVSSKNDGVSWAGLRKTEVESQYDVTYAITISAYSKKGLIASSMKTITILPVAEARPPVSPSDFPGEYFFAASSPQQSRLSLTKAPTLTMEVAGQEPEPLILSPFQSSSNGSTLVQFIVKALPRPSMPFGPLWPTQCTVHARLVTKTLITPDRIDERSIPTLDQARSGSNSSLKIQKSDEQEFTVALPHWSHIAAGKKLSWSTIYHVADRVQVPLTSLHFQGSPSYST